MNALDKPRDITQLPPLGKPLYIQSFLPTSEHIRSKSVISVEAPDDLTSNLLGVSAWEESCLTCDGFLEECPGHDGCIELPVPIYRIFFVKRLIQILNCVCFYCQRLRLPTTDKRYDWIRSLPLKNRLDYLEKYSKPYKYCGQQPKDGDEEDTHTEAGGQEFSAQSSCDIEGACHKMFVQFKNEDRDSTFLRAIIRLEVADHVAHRTNPDWRPVSIGPQDIFDCISNLEPETLHMLGCNKWNPPQALMWDVLNVPSLNTRPCHTFSGIGVGKKRIYNDWTKFLRNIVIARNDLREVMKLSSETVTCCHYIFNDIESKSFSTCFRYGYLEKKAREVVKKRLKPELKKTNYGAVETAWRNLMKHTAAFHSHRHKKFIQKGSYGKPLVNVEERYKFQKYGRLRGNVIARRVNNAGRGVLEGDMSLHVDQVGIPKQEAMNLTRKIYVNSYNLKEVQKWILNGPFVYPGANYVTMKTGEEKHLAFYDNRRDLNPSDILFVRRHLLDDDLALVGRQPTLHRPSMMTFRIKVIDGFAIRLHYATFTPLGADCDGDEVNFQIPQNLDAIAEMQEISSVRNNIMKDGKIWIKFIQNAVVAAYIMTGDQVLLTRSQMIYITKQLNLWEYPEPCEWVTEPGQTEPEPRWKGHQLVSLLFPPDFNMVIKDQVVIRNGQMLEGRLNASALNGTGGILHHMYRDYADRQVTMNFLHHGYILFQHFLDIFGHSAGYFDCAIDFHHEDAVKEGRASLQMTEMLRRMDGVQENVDKMEAYADRFTKHTPESLDATIETNLREHIDKVNTMSMKAVVDYHEYVNQQKNDNGILHMINSGAKGSTNVINQMCGVVSQIYVMYKRYPHTSSHFLAGHKSMEAYGFIRQSYSKGLPLQAIIAEAHATCESVIGKNKGTSKSGYTVRKLTTCMMGVIIDHFKRAIDTNGRVIWSMYGNDGYDPQCMTNCKLRLLGFKEWDILRRYGTMFDLKEIISLSSLSTKAQWTKLFNQDQTTTIDTVWFGRLAHFTWQGSTISDQTFSLEACMTPEALEEWRLIKNRNTTVDALIAEARDLYNLKQRVQMLLSRCHESFDLSIVRAPFSFSHLFERCRGAIPTTDQVDLHPLHYRQFAVDVWERLMAEKLVVSTNLTFKSLFFDWLSTRSLMLRWKFGLAHLAWLGKEIVSLLIRALIQAGESVGINATQNTGGKFYVLMLCCLFQTFTNSLFCFVYRTLFSDVPQEPASQWQVLWSGWRFGTDQEHCGLQFFQPTNDYCAEKVGQDRHRSQHLWPVSGSLLSQGHHRLVPGLPV